MKINLIAVMITAVLALGVTTYGQGVEGRSRAVDLNKLFNDYYKTPIASAKLKESAETYNKEHEEMLAGYKKQIEELNKLREDQDKAEYSAAVREEKKKALQDKLAETQKLERDIQEYRTSHRQILDQQTQRMRQGILKEIMDVITKEAKDSGYTYVFDKSGNTLNGAPEIVYVQDSLDITEDILKILNKNAPKLSESTTPKTDEKAKDKKSEDKK